MWEFRVDWAGQYFTANFSELFSFVAECDDFGWAYESEVQRIEEQNDVFTFIVLNADITEVSVVPGGGFELRGAFSDQWHIFFINITSNRKVSHLIGQKLNLS